MAKSKESSGSTSCQMKVVGNRKYSCSVELTLQVIGGKWKPVILYHLGRRGTMRFGEIRKSMPSITPKMLTQQLRELEADGVVLRRVYAEVPPRVDYSLTGLGESVMPVLKALCRWGRAYEKLLSARENGRRAV